MMADKALVSIILCINLFVIFSFKASFLTAKEFAGTAAISL